MLATFYKTTLFALIILANNASFAQQNWSLEQCIDSALVNNTGIKILENQEALSELKNKEVKSNLLPKIYGNAEYKYFIDLPYQLMPLSVFGGPEGQFKEAQFGVPHNINLNLTIQVPVYSSKIYGAIEKTEIGKNMVDLQVEKTKEQIYFEVSALYRNTQLLMNKESFLDSSIKNTEVMLSTINRLKDALLATGTDAKKVELQLLTLQAQKDEINSKTKQILNGLKMYMGLNLDYNLAVDPTIELSNSPIYEVKPSIETKLNQLQQELIKTDISSLKKSRYIPDVGVVGYLGTNGFGYTEAPNEFLNFYPLSFVGLKITHPLFNGTVTNKQIAQKNIEFENLQLQQTIVNDKTSLEIYNAKENLNTALNQLDLKSKLITLADEIFDETKLLHKQGLASTQDLIMADNELRLAKQNYLSAVTACIVADLELQKLTGNILK